MSALRQLIEPLERAAASLARLVELVEAAPLRGVGPEDLLTEDEVARYVRIQRAQVRGWLALACVPRALSPGRAHIALYRACDVRRALESGARTTHDSAWDSLGA